MVKVLLSTLNWCTEVLSVSRRVTYQCPGLFYIEPDIQGCTEMELSSALTRVLRGEQIERRGWIPQTWLHMQTPHLRLDSPVISCSLSLPGLSWEANVVSVKRGPSWAERWEESKNESMSTFAIKRHTACNTWGISPCYCEATGLNISPPYHAEIRSSSAKIERHARTDWSPLLTR